MNNDITNSLISRKFWDRGSFYSPYQKAVVTNPGIIYYRTNLANSIDFSNTFQGIWDGTKYVVGGEATTSGINTSTDGITWTRRTSPSGCPTNGWRNIAWNGSTGYVAFGTSSSSIMYSTNGITWSNSSMTPATSFGDGNSISWNGTVFCVISGGNERSTFTSTNGVSWTNTASILSAPYYFQYLTAGNSIFCAMVAPFPVGYDNRLYTSTNGVTWTLRDTDTTDPELYSVVFGPQKFVAFYRNMVKVSTDGITWVKHKYKNLNSNALTNTTGPAQMYEMVWSKYYSVFLAKGGDALYFSTDGISWVTRTDLCSASLISDARGIVCADKNVLFLSRNSYVGSADLEAKEVVYVP